VRGRDIDTPAAERAMRAQAVQLFRGYPDGVARRHHDPSSWGVDAQQAMEGADGLAAGMTMTGRGADIGTAAMGCDDIGAVFAGGATGVQ